MTFTRWATPRLAVYAWLAAGDLWLAVALRRPVLVVLAAPFALVVAAGQARARDPELDATVTVVPERVAEGDDVTLTVSLHGPLHVPRVEVEVPVPAGLELRSGVNPRVVHVEAGSEVTAVFAFRAQRWGVAELGRARIRVRDGTAIFQWEAKADGARPVRVYPRPETLHGLIRPEETQVYAGNRTARVKAAGVEFAYVRPFVPGDRIRDVNWRVTARHRRPWVTERHPERNSDVVVFLDAFTDALLPDAVRAAATLVSGYTDQRDRVGLVSFGGVTEWIEPGVGLRQLYRIVDRLIDTRAYLSYAWKEIGLVPARTLPPKALVVAVSPLDDDRALAALADLRARRFDVAIVEVSPVERFPPGPRSSDVLAHRIWRLERENTRRLLQRLGVAVVTWSPELDLAAVVEEVDAFRRHARRLTG